MTRPGIFLGVFLSLWPLIVFSFTFNPLSNHDLVLGQVITVQWTPSGSGTITLSLVNMDTGDQTTISNTNNIGAYTWTLMDNTPVGNDFSLFITDGGDGGAYSDKFKISGPSDSTSASVPSTSAATDKPSESTMGPTSIPLASTSTGVSSGITAMSTLSSVASATAGEASESTATPTATATTLTTAVSSAGNTAAIAASATDTSSPSSSSPSTAPSQSSNGLSPSGKKALIICLAVGIPLTCLVSFMFLCRNYTCRRRRPADSDSRPPSTFIPRFARRDNWILGSLSAIDSKSEKRVTADESEYLTSPTISQGVRSSLATQDTGMWHYKPELAGSDPKHESSAQFLAPVELPAWEPDELDPSVEAKTEEQRELHERDDEERVTQSDTSVENGVSESGNK